MDIESQPRNTWIALGTLAGLGVLLGFFKTWKWFSRSGKDIVDLPTIGKFFFHIFGILGTVLLLVISGVCVVWFFIFRTTATSNDLGKISGFQNILKILIIVAFVLKTLDVLHLVVRQSNIEIFFMDWERSKKGRANAVSVWRTYFVANEFNEIQTFRRINVPFQSFFVLFFLRVVDLQRFTVTNCATAGQTNCSAEADALSRTGLNFLIFLGTGVVQYLVSSIIYQRLFEDKIINFVDLCSVSNISVFILDQNQHGYYIHGRSPNGTTDVNMKELLMSLYREANAMSGTRGLQEESNEQLFIMKTNQSFRRQYESLFQNYYNAPGVRRTREENERYTDMLLQSYQNLNSYLCAFIDRSLTGHHYVIRNRYFLEKLLDYEFQVRAPPGRGDLLDNLLFIDNERTFSSVLFYGEERSLFFWNMSTFLFIDFVAKNSVLALILTYLTNRILVGLRNSLGRKNLARKTLIPKNFLI